MPLSREERNARQRRYRQENLERYRNYDRGRDRRAYDRQWSQRPARLAWQAKYDRARREHKNALRRQRYLVTRGVIIARVCARQKKDSIGVALRSGRYRSRRLGVEIGGLAKTVVAELWEEQNGRCFYCRECLVGFDLEHKMPLSRGGDSSRANLCLACRRCNRRKQARTAEEFLSRVTV